MAKFTTDPSDRWKALPKGEYNVMVTKSELKDPRPDPRDPNKEKHPYIEVTMQVMDGEYQGENITDRLSLSPKARPRLNGFLYAVGLATSDSKGEQEFDSDDFVNKFLSVKGDIEVFNGQERFRPSSFKVHPDVARTQEANMNAQAAEAKTATPAAAAPAPAPATQKPAPAPAKAAPARRPI